MLDAFRLIPALQVIFKQEIEFVEDSFVELNEAQEEAYRQKGNETDERIYRVVAFEPKAVERSEEKVTMELSIVTESQRTIALDAVAFVYRASSEMQEKNPTFAQRLAYLRPRLPPVVIGAETGLRG